MSYAWERPVKNLPRSSQGSTSLSGGNSHEETQSLQSGKGYRWLHNPTGYVGVFPCSVFDALRELEIMSMPGQCNQRGGWLMTALGQRFRSPGIIPLSIFADTETKGS